MQAELAIRPATSHDIGASTVIAHQTARRAVRSGALWGVVFGVYVASQALAYASSYKTAAQRAHLAKEFGTNAGTSALVGPAHDIQTVAGFTVWKSLAVLAIVGAIWGLLTATRLLRGEEDAGRWELLLAGRTTRRAAAAQALAGLACGLAALWVVTAVITLIVGRSSKVGIGAGGALFLAVALVSGAAMFLAVGALASQLAATRRQASAYAGAALAVSYALRMVADSGAGLGWLRWASPLGWVEELQPLTAPHPLVLLPIAALTGALGLFTVHLAGERDLGASTLPDRSSSQAHTRLLFGPTGLDIRIARPSLVGWAVGIAAYGLLFGLVAKSGGSAVSSSSSLSRVLSRLGAVGTEAYLGVAFLILAAVVAIMAAGQIGTMRAEEATGRLDNFLVRPVSRWSWLGGRLLIAAVAVLVGGLICGVFTWIGAASQHSGVGFGTLLDAGLNVVPPAVCLLGLGTLVFGVSPRATTFVTYGVLVWSFLIELLGGIVGINHWVLDTSLFHQMAAAPAVSPDWTSGGALLAIGALAAVVGGIAFRFRDLQSE
ncbi:MAG: ABC transporter permease subunit [Acidimicrobiales bacterium]|jgi:ABC-2 type transport system permease protein